MPKVIVEAPKDNPPKDNPPEVKETRKKFAPKVQVRSGGKISATLEGIVAEFKSIYLDMDCRWVYHSATKPELSNIMGRRAEGYAIVKANEFTGEFLITPFVDEKGLIRVADTVLMKIPTGQRDANRVERQSMANAQLQTIEAKYKDSMDNVGSGKHRAASRGAVKLEERDHEYEIEQRSKDG